MTVEAAHYLLRAEEDLTEASLIAGIGLANVAARSAYYAAFHAAEALIIHRTGRVAKTHSGVRTEFARLAKAEPAIPQTMTTFLAQAYEYKEISDYSVDPRTTITMENAEWAIRNAREFVTLIRTVIG